MSNLSISRIVSVNVVLSPLAAQAQDLSTLLVLGTSDVIDVVQRLRTYTSAESVAADFGVNAPEYQAALLWFSQSPQPTQIKIGRWAQSETPGQLIGGTLSDQAQQIATWNAIANGGFQFELGGVAVILNNINFAAATNLNGVADIIAATPGFAGLTVEYDDVYKRFVWTSVATGVGASVSFLAAAGGQDISSLLGGTAGDGAYEADGIDAETPAAAATLFDTLFGQTWYALTFTSLTDDEHMTVCPVIEASSNKHIYGISTQESGCLSSAIDTDIMSRTKAGNFKRSLVQYSSTNPYSICSYLGRALTVNYNGQNTVITMKFKQEPTITAESLTADQVDALEAKNGNVFVSYQNDTAIVENGTQASGNFTDEVTGTDWLATTIQTACYNLLYLSPTKIPQTDQGSNRIVNTIESVCSQGVANGLIAPGIWDSDGFGTLNPGDYMPQGFYVFAPPVSSQSAADRAARKSVPIQVAVKLAGAVHTIDVTINVNR